MGGCASTPAVNPINANAPPWCVKGAKATYTKTGEECEIVEVIQCVFPFLPFSLFLFFGNAKRNGCPLHLNAKEGGALLNDADFFGAFRRVQKAMNCLAAATLVCRHFPPNQPKEISHTAHILLSVSVSFPHPLNFAKTNDRSTLSCRTMQRMKHLWRLASAITLERRQPSIWSVCSDEHLRAGFHAVRPILQPKSHSDYEHKHDDLDVHGCGRSWPSPFPF